jgi:hypothetical protein
MTRTTAHSNQRTRTRVTSNIPFSALDEERQASMADEGGVSGALMEVEGEELTSTGEAPSRRAPWRLAIGLALLGMALIFAARRYRPR